MTLLPGPLLTWSLSEIQGSPAPRATSYLGSKQGFYRGSRGLNQPQLEATLLAPPPPPPPPPPHRQTARLGTSLNHHHLGLRIRKDKAQNLAGCSKPTGVKTSTNKGTTGCGNVKQSLSKEGGDSRERVRSLQGLARSPGTGSRPDCGEQLWEAKGFLRLEESFRENGPDLSQTLYALLGQAATASWGRCG